MTLDQAIALQPQWLQIWMNFLFVGGFVLPLLLLIWRKSRIAGAVVFLGTLCSAFSVMWMFDKMGYVRLLGLPHIIFWLPVLPYVFKQLQSRDLPKIPKVLMAAMLVIILISLAFDITDTIRWIIGEREPIVAMQ